MQKEYFNLRAMILAHRGMSGEFPENTLLSFKKAYELGVDVLETDVRFTKDKKFAVIHDSTVDRTTNGSGKVIDRTLDELKNLDAGHNFTSDNGKTYQFRGKGVNLISLEELFEKFPGARFNIDLKDKIPEQIEYYAKIIKKYNAQSRVLTASIHGVNLRSVRKCVPEMATSFSMCEILSFLALAKTGLLRQSSNFNGDALQVPAFLCCACLVEKSFIKQAHKKGHKVQVWTIDKESDMRRLIDIGVDGIFTNFPDRLRAVLNEVKK